MNDQVGEFLRIILIKLETIERILESIKEDSKNAK